MQVAQACRCRDTRLWSHAEITSCSPIRFCPPRNTESPRFIHKSNVLTLLNFTQVTTLFTSQPYNLDLATLYTPYFTLTRQITPPCSLFRILLKNQQTAAHRVISIYFPRLACIISHFRREYCYYKLNSCNC